MTARQGAAAGLLVAAALGGPWLAGPAPGQERESAGMITEIKVLRGRVEVRPPGAPEWRRAGPLLALRPGDTVRATEDAWAVVLLSGGRGTVKVTRANSPFVVGAPQPGESTAQKALSLVEASLGFLSAGPREAPRATLATRGRRPPPAILSPRNGPVLPDSLTFEWLGSRLSRYTVRVVGPGGPVLERKDVAGATLDYPVDAPRLTPGVHYRLEVASAGHPVQEAWFEVLDPDRAGAIRRDLAELTQTLAPSVPPNSLVALEAGLLARNGLLHDARLVLLAALARDPDEPTLHLLLGKVYQAAGLPRQAAEAFDEAGFLTSGAARR